MKILSAAQIREVDANTITHEPVASIDLMERAAAASVRWIEKNILRNYTYKIFCGPGNNGGDGLAIARMLFQNGYQIEVFVLEETGNESEEYKINKRRLIDLNRIVISEIRTKDDFPFVREDDCILDALFGTGLTRPLSGIAAELVKFLNGTAAIVVSIDMPSGLPADHHAAGEIIIEADETLSFQIPKLAFFFPENEKYTGRWHLLDIGLDNRAIGAIDTDKHYITRSIVKNLLRPRSKFSNKGNYGHALIVAGSYGKMGAAVLAAKGCQGSGSGLLTMHVPKCGYEIMQITCYEAMVSCDANDFMNTDELNTEAYSAIGVGPGIGTRTETENMLESLLKKYKRPLVLDADALNLLSGRKELLKLIPEGSILTPHPKEFERLAGKSKNDFDRFERQIAFSKEYRVTVILKGAHSCVTFPTGESWFNSTGNPGMAKGGSGDVLTGILTSLLAQGYSETESALIGVYVHGLAGDFSSAHKGMDGMIARDLINELPLAFLSLRNI